MSDLELAAASLQDRLDAMMMRMKEMEMQLRGAIQSSQQNAINFRHSEVLRIEAERRAERAEAVLRDIAEKDTYGWGVTARQYFADKDRQTKPHCHVASYADGVLVDTCGLCGKDLRNPIHSSENKDRQTEGK